MTLRPLHDDFGVEVEGVDLSRVDGGAFADIRALFEEHTLLLFRGQSLDEPAHRRLAEMVSPLEDLRDAPAGVPVERPIISNKPSAGALVDDDALRMLDIKANFLWHTDSTFLPTPSLANVLVGYVVPRSGGETEFASTRVGWSRLPERLKARARDAVLIHRFSHTRTQMDPRLGALPAYTKFPDMRWRTVWRNPLNGHEALYAGAHACAVEGLSEQDGLEFIAELNAAVTQADNVYAHAWRAGDVLIWDQRAMLHRGTPWNYEEERTLASFVTSARESDGIASVRP